jgi:hypothetical protein
MAGINSMRYVAPFMAGRAGVIRNIAQAGFESGVIDPATMQDLSAAQIQLAHARRDVFIRAATTGQVAEAEIKTAGGKGTLAKVKALPVSQLKARLKSLREADLGYRPGYFDPTATRLEDLFDLSSNEALGGEIQGIALQQANDLFNDFSAKYNSERATIASGERDVRRRRREQSPELAQMKRGARSERVLQAISRSPRLAAMFEEGLMRTQDLFRRIQDPDLDPVARARYETEYDIEMSGLRAGFKEYKPATEREIRKAREAIAKRETVSAAKLKEAMLGPVDVTAPGKRAAPTMTEEQRARLAQADRDIARGKEMLSATDILKPELQEALDLVAKGNEARAQVTRELVNNTKATKDATKQQADFTSREALGLTYLVRGLGGRAAGFFGGMAGVSGAELPSYVATRGLMGGAGALQDLATNNFIQKGTLGAFGGLIGATILSAATNVFGSFAERGAKIRQEVGQLRTERHLELAQILNPSPVAAAFNTGFETFKTGPVDLDYFYEKYGIEAISAIRDGAKRYNSEVGEISSKNSAFALTTKYKPGVLNLTTEQAKFLTAGARMAVMNKERDFLEGVLNTAMDRFGYGGAVSGSEMLKAASAISAEGIPIQRLARSLYGKELSFVGPGGRFQPSMGTGGYGNVPYQAGVSELAIGAYATAIAKSSGLGMNAVQSAIAMQGMGLSNIGLGVNKLTGGVSSTALSNFAAAIRGGLPVSAASQVMGTALAMNREGMFTDLTSLAAHTRGLSEAGITPGVIGMAKSNMMQLSRGAYQTLSAPYRSLTNSMAFLYALERSGGDPGKAMEMARTMDTSSPEFIEFTRSRLGPELAGYGIQATGNLARSDVGKFMAARPKEMTFMEGIENELYKLFPFLSTTKPGEIANRLDIERSKADKSVSEEERAASRQASLDDIAVKLDRIANSLGALVGF